MSGIKCPHCRSSLALDRVGVHFQKFCSAIKSPSEREASVLKFNRLFTKMQAHGRGELTVEELQTEADKIFLGR